MIFLLCCLVCGGLANILGQVPVLFLEMCQKPRTWVGNWHWSLPAVESWWKRREVMVDSPYKLLKVFWEIAAIVHTAHLFFGLWVLSFLIPGVLCQVSDCLFLEFLYPEATYSFFSGWLKFEVWRFLDALKVIFCWVGLWTLDQIVHLFWSWSE